MQFTILAALASFAVGTHAAAIKLPRQGASNPRLAQFRVFSAAGCSDLNEGFYTVDTDQANQCHDFSGESDSTPNGYVSIVLQGTTAAAANCELLLYSDTACSETETISSLDTCEDASVVQDGASYPTWNSYYYKCTSSNTTETSSTA
ncbi:hypothetical protein PFICI_14406 [Pestalotiopsis fici W106-1]|uniref:AA1-like domain-containing protein n=1 Tax=Pestalotiopsis fici (strain W106-1 / CGMCC3.15140) TaxID=1229662 RepID=W3WHQ2_PESFW|nr:uncharacterized protein PFICI_14406 [Pestalotiopsis fici W106-1]ETS73460.1 hypothetical protein PFICI_14406 [Pestalotiopsis fici W106-1]